jgi:hypothetical protein
MYCGHAYKSKGKFTLHKAFLLLGDVFLVTKDDETVWRGRMAGVWKFDHTLV